MRERGLAVDINPGSADRRTSTAGCDPSGDYTRQLFRGWAGGRSDPARGSMVGGRQTLPLPAGQPGGGMAHQS